MPSTAREPVVVLTPARLTEVVDVTDDELHIEIDDTAGRRTVRLTIVGDLDLVVESELVQRFTDVVKDARPDRVVLDLTRVPFLDSSGLRGLLRCARAAEDHGVLMTLDVVPGPVPMLLDTAGVRDWFSFE